MKLDEIRALSAQDLQARVTELREEQFRLRFRAATETLEQPLRLREVRRDIARVLTVLRQKELEAAPTGDRKGKPKGTAKKSAPKGAAKTVRTKSAR
jgi:large subunit ribosomal protein L29